MLRVRAVRKSDHGELLNLAELAGIGFTSLPADAAVLAAKIERSEMSFARTPEYPHGEGFLFVLEDMEAGKLVGTTGVVAHVGIRRPFYSYKLSTLVQAHDKLDVYSLQRVMHMVNDYTGASEIGSLFLIPEYRRDGIGKFLSRCRYLMLAEFPEIFSDTVISEIRGVQDAKGNSPFYDNVAKQFFLMPFQQADFVNATQGGQFISDLMPKYPIYVILLKPEAQAVIGQPFEASRPAKTMLETEGFTHEGYVDVFDAGPTMQAERANIRTVKHSRKTKVAAVKDTLEGPDYLIANTHYGNFMMTRAPLLETEEGVIITEATARALEISKGDEVRYAA